MLDKKLPSHKDPFPYEMLLQFAKVRLIALDLDGTLLSSNKSLLPFSVSTLAAQLNHHKYDVRTTIATGRTLTGSLSLIRKLVFGKDTPIVLYNGAVIMTKDGKILSRKLLSASSLQGIVTICKQYPVKIIAYSIVSGRDKPVEYAFGFSSIDKPRFDYNKMKVSWLESGEVLLYEPSVIVLHYVNPLHVGLICSILDGLGDIVYTLGSSYIEICPHGATKGNALRQAASILHLSDSEVLAMGDNNNDVSMLRWAGIGVAVGNASVEAKACSDYIANYSVEKGAKEVLLLVQEAIDLHTKSISRAHKMNMGTSSNWSQHQIPFLLSHKTTHHLLSCEDAMASVHAESYFCLDAETLNIASEIGLLPKYLDSHGKEYFLNDDYFKLASNNLCITKFISGKSTSYTISFGRENSVSDISVEFIRSSAFVPCIANIVNYSSSTSDSARESVYSCEYLYDSQLHTCSLELLNFGLKQVDRVALTDSEQSNTYLNPPQYMGSKRGLCSFLVEALSSILPPDGVVLDLMCGSGVASNAFSKFWVTYASDAQDFCKYLASIQGAGFDSSSAEHALASIIEHFHTHFDTLKGSILDAIESETEIFCSEANNDLKCKYELFINHFPTISNRIKSLKWNPVYEVERRLNAKLLYPYCLFTAYFANTYFGVRQALEIDSLRFAIDQIVDERIQKWALGTLVSTVSSNGSTYGGHFAQPRVQSVLKLNQKALSNLLVIRSRSIVHDFVSRFLSIAASSESKKRHVNTVDGPWYESINHLNELLPNSNVVVYLDPPYTRDEYSRYYHVLETLVKYNYPSCSGRGLTPKSLDRFRSEFFTRDSNEVKIVLTGIISNILKLGWSCAWSYSNSASANIVDVIKAVSMLHSCNIKSYSIPSVHKSHGGAKPKSVVEYLVIFVPVG